MKDSGKGGLGKLSHPVAELQGEYPYWARIRMVV